MPDVRRILGHKGQMPCLARGLLSVAEDGAAEWLIVGVNGEATALEVGAEMLDRQEKGQKLPVKRTVLAGESFLEKNATGS